MARKRLMTILAIIINTVLFTGAPNATATPACYGSSCNGLNPANLCDSDAITVAATDVGYGMLELRYSPSCVANWARFSEYGRAQVAVAVKQVTIWNPGAESYGITGHAVWVPPFGSSHWSAMTDGTKIACSGVEVNSAAAAFNTRAEPGSFEAHHHNSGTLLDYSENTRWIWGPCY